MRVGILLKIRLLQLYRIAQAIGVIRISFVAVFFVLIMLLLYQSLTKSDDAHNLVLTAAISGLFFVHINRLDYDFLRKNIRHAQIQIFVEYLFFLLPVFALLLITSCYKDVGILLVVILAIVFLLKPSKLRIRIKWLDFVSNFVLSDLFEWKAGLRKNFIVIALVMIIGLVGSIFNVLFPIIALVVISLFICFYYNVCESREILEAKELGAKRFLQNKLKRHLTCWLVVQSPLIVATLIHYSFVIYVMLVLLMLLNMLICIILLKYFYYFPYHRSPVAGIFGAIILILSLTPGFCCIVWIYNISLYQKTINHLDTYLYDYN